MTLTARLTQAEVLTPDGLGHCDLGVSDGVIAPKADGRIIDLSGYLVLPAMVDIHGDGFERHLAPRRGAMKDLGQGLLSADAELASNGITTATLAQFFSWEGGMRGADFAARFLKARQETPLLTDTLVQLRFETHMLADYAGFADLVAAYAVPYVVFNDHLPHAALRKGKRPPRLTGQALKGGRSPEAHLEMLKSLHAHTDEVPAALTALAVELLGQGVRLGSHDDDTAEVRAGFQAMGVSISEFPETLEAAQAARDTGGQIILGAPNVVRGGSHSGNVAAQDLVADGLCDALASDYHYPALRQAAFKLADEGSVDFAAAWGLISAGPARILGLDDRGTLAAGQRADLVVLHRETRRIEATLCAGQITYLAGEAARRFVG